MSWQPPHGPGLDYFLLHSRSSLSCFINFTFFSLICRRKLENSPTQGSMLLCPEKLMLQNCLFSTLFQIQSLTVSEAHGPSCGRQGRAEPRGKREFHTLQACLFTGEKVEPGKFHAQQWIESCLVMKDTRVQILAPSLTTYLAI